MDWLSIKGGMMKMKSIRKAIIASLPFILLFSLVLPVSHGENGTATMSILPSHQAVYFNDTFTVDIVVDAKDVNAVQCWIGFNASLLTAIDVENGEMFATLANNGTIDNTAGIISNIMGFSITPIDASGGKVFATITFQAKEKVGISSIELLSDYAIINDTYVPTYNATVEVRNYPVYVSIEPAYNLIGNETALFDVTVDPNGNEISIMTFDITFDPNYFQVTGVTDGGLFSTLTPNIDNVAGVVSIFAIQTPIPPGVTNAGTLATIEFTPLQTAVTDINITNMDIIDVDGEHLYSILQNATLEADLTPPDVTLEFGTPYYNGSNWVSSLTPIYINATDAHDYTVYYRIWSGSWQGWQSEAVNTNAIIYLPEEGMYYIEYYAEDEFNNTSPIDNVTVYVDNTPPVTSIELTGTLGENGWYVSTVTVNLTAVDINGSGVGAIYYKIDDGNWTEYTGAFDITADGIHTLYYYAVDNLGNTETEKSETIKIDKTLPTLSYNITGTLGENGWYVSTVTVELSAFDDNLAEFKYKVNGAWQDYTGPFNLSDGIYTISFYARDDAGNNASDEFDVSVDTTKPTATYTLQGTYEDGKYTSDVTVVLQASDNLAGVKEIRYRLDGGNWQIFPGNSGSDVVSSEGTHTIVYYAVDNAGNEGVQHQVTFEILKNKPPVADFSFSPQQPTDLDTITFADQSTDEDGEIVAWHWDFGDGTTSNEQNPTHKYADNGTYIVKLTVTDDKGATETAQKIIEVANVAPVAKFTYEPDKPKIREEIKFNATLSFDDDGNIVNYTWDFGDGNISYEINPTHAYIKAGTYNVTLTVIDNDGATHQTVLQIKVTEEKVNIWLYLIIIVVLIIIAVAVVAVWKKRTKSS